MFNNNKLNEEQLNQIEENEKKIFDISLININKKNKKHQNNLDNKLYDDKIEKKLELKPNLLEPIFRNEYPFLDETLNKNTINNTFNSMSGRFDFDNNSNINNIDNNFNYNLLNQNNILKINSINNSLNFPLFDYIKKNEFSKTYQNINNNLFHNNNLIQNNNSVPMNLINNNFIGNNDYYLKNNVTNVYNKFNELLNKKEFFIDNNNLLNININQGLKKIFLNSRFNQISLFPNNISNLNIESINAFNDKMNSFLLENIQVCTVNKNNIIDNNYYLGKK